MTYQELNREVDRLSYGLVRAGLHPGDICVLMMPNSIDWIIAYYALAKVGAVVLPVNFLYRVGELEHIFEDSGARAFIGHKDYLEHPRQVMAHLPKMDLRIDYQHRWLTVLRLSIPARISSAIGCQLSAKRGLSQTDR